MPLLLTLVLLGYLALTGRGWLALWGVNLGHTRSWLIAPSLGLALNAVTLLILNQAGWPVMSFARPMMIAFTVLALGVAIRRRQWPHRDLLPFALIALLGLGLGAWPMARYGYSWISYGNDDMTNYCLSAQRALHDGFYRVPEFAELAGGDCTQFYWFSHVALLMRAGSELMLAFVAGVIGRPPVDIFMPLIFSLALTQLLALGGLLYSCPRRKSRALVACLFLAVSPLWIYGSLHQLIAQVGGVALLMATLTLTARTRFAAGWRGQLRQAGPIGLLVAGICVCYPEVIPFVIFSLGLFITVRIARNRSLIPGQFAVALASTALLCLLLRHNILATVTTLFGQAAQGLTQEDIRLTIFPYFLMPKGLSLLLGWETFTAPWDEPWSSICIGAGLIAVVLVVASCVRGVIRFRPASCLCLVMLAVGAKLFQGNNGFGLFKLAMFITPVFLAELAGLVFSLRPAWARVLMPSMVAGLWVLVAQGYVRTSTPRRDIFVEVFDASISRGQPPTGEAALLADVGSSPIAKLAAGAQNGAPIIFLSQPFFQRFTGRGLYTPPMWIWRFMPDKDVPSEAGRLRAHLAVTFFAPQKAFGTVFWPPPPPAGNAFRLLLTSRGELESFNKLAPATMPVEGLFGQVPLDRLRNHLVFVHSESGQHYYLGQPGLVGVYKTETDIYSRADRFFAIGQKLVFQVINPTPVVRLRLSLTDSILGQGNTHLPEQAVVLGGQEVPAPLGLVGSGSANVYSAPMHVLPLNGWTYLALDLMRPPSHLYSGRATGLNRLYNSVVQLDSRLLNGYCRDISLISEEEYQHLRRPSSVNRFPRDLLDQPGLEYSGFYEDGWISRHAFVTLGAVRPGEQVVLKGMLPLLPGNLLASNRLEVRLNGRLVSTAVLVPGEFEVSSPVDFIAGQVRVDLSFAQEAPLPSNDLRPVAALVRSIAIQTGP